MQAKVIKELDLKTVKETKEMKEIVDYVCAAVTWKRLSGRLKPAKILLNG